MRTSYSCPVCGASILIYQLLKDNKGSREEITYVCGKKMLVALTFGTPDTLISTDGKKPDPTFPDGDYTVKASQPVKSFTVCGNAEKVIERMQEK